MMIQDPSVELVPQKVRTKDWLQMELEKHSSWICWHEKHWHKRPLKCAWIEMDTGWHIWFAFILHKKCQICFSHSSPEVPDLILSHSSQDVPDDSLFFHKKRPICTMLTYSCWVLQELLYRIRCPQIRKVRICSSMCQQIVYRKHVQGKEKGNYNRSLTFLGKCKVRQPHPPPASLC